MTQPTSGKWTGWLVCPEGPINVSITLDVSDDGRIEGEYNISDTKYPEKYKSGNIVGTYADNLVTLELADEDDDDFKANFYGEVHPSLPGKLLVLSGYVLVHRRSSVETGTLVVFSEQQDRQAAPGWDG